MAGETNYIPPSLFEGSYRNKNQTVTYIDNYENTETFKHVKSKKPAWMPLRKSVSSIPFNPAAESQLDVGPDGKKSRLEPVFRSGSCSEIGPKPYMEDEHVCMDELLEHAHTFPSLVSSGAFYGVFDGHGGSDAAIFTKDNILRLIFEDPHYPMSVKKATKSAFLKADHAFANAVGLDTSSGTTALTTLIIGRTMLVANVGDCRAVLGKRGTAIDMSRDHKPNYPSERLRIERLGGIVYDGYLNGKLSVARAIGDCHMKGGSNCPLSVEPELREIVLTEEDEFLIIGSDGLWDVMNSQCAVTIARRELMLHNDPERCARELVREALKRNTYDNLTVLIVCFSEEPPPLLDMEDTKFYTTLSDLNLRHQDALENQV